MPIVRRSESGLLPFFQLALGRMQAKREQEILSNQYGFEEQMALAESTYKGAEGLIGGIFGGLAGGGGGIGGIGGGGLGSSLGDMGAMVSQLPGASFVGPALEQFGAIAAQQQGPSYWEKVAETFSRSLDTDGKSRTSRQGFGKAIELAGGGFDLSSVGGRKAFDVATRREAATVASQRREEAADNAFYRKMEVNSARQQQRLVMEGLTRGDLKNYRIGLSETEEENLASLQNARNIVTAGTVGGGDGGFRLSPPQQRIALDRINSEIAAIQPSLVRLTPQEIAERDAPTPESMMAGTVKVDGVTMGLDRNGTVKAVNDPTQERSRILKEAREFVEKLDGYDDLTGEERNQAVREQFEHDWAIVTGEAPEPAMPSDDPSAEPRAPKGTMVGGLEIPPAIEKPEKVREMLDAAMKDFQKRENKEAGDDDPGTDFKVSARDVHARVKRQLKILHPEQMDALVAEHAKVLEVEAAAAAEQRRIAGEQAKATRNRETILNDVATIMDKVNSRKNQTPTAEERRRLLELRTQLEGL